MHLYINGTEAVNYAATLNRQELALPSNGNYQLGGSDFGVQSPKSSTGFNGIIYGAKFSSTAYSKDQIAQDYSAWINQLAIKGVNTSAVYTMPPSFPASETSRLMCLGESNTYGHGLFSPSTMNYCAVSASSIMGAPNVVDDAADSDNAGIMRELYAQVVQPQYHPGVSNIFVLFTNVNDCKTIQNPTYTDPADPYEGDTASDAFSRELVILNAAKAQGWIPIVATGLSQSGPPNANWPNGDDDAKDSCNPAIRSGTAQNGFLLWDAASDPGFGADGASLNVYQGSGTAPANDGSPYFYQSDTIHATQYGQTRLAASLARVANLAIQGNTPVVVTAATATISSFAVNANPVNNSIALTLDSCIGPTGTSRTIHNLQTSGTYTVSVVPAAGETISNASTVLISNGGTVTFNDVFDGDSTGGCHWITR